MTTIDGGGIRPRRPKPRGQIVRPEATAYDHCISRCVRRAFLCSPDRFTDRNFDHRKQWLVERMTELAAICASDICAYGILRQAHVWDCPARHRTGRVGSCPPPAQMLRSSPSA